MPKSSQDNAHAQFAEALEDLRGAFGILHDQRFGHLDLELPRQQAFAVEICFTSSIRLGSISCADEMFTATKTRLRAAVGALPDAELAARPR